MEEGKKCLFTVFALLFITCQSDVILQNFKYDIKDMYKNKPKLWHRYIQMFLVKECSSNNTAIKSSTKKLLHSISKASTDFAHVLYHKQLSLQDGKYKKIFFERLFNILHASGHLDINSHFGTFHKQFGHGFITFLFQPDTRVRINLTFHQIYFYKSLMDTDFLVVKNHSNLVEEGRFSPSRTLNEGSTVFYGHHSAFSFYPQFLEFKVQADYTRYHFQILGSYTVIDKHVVQSLMMKDAYPCQTNLKYLIIPTLLQIYKFFLQVRKIFKIVVRCHNCTLFKFIVFDGPGIVSKVLSALKSKENIRDIGTSSFQCVVQTLRNYSEHMNSKGSLTYAAQRVEKVKKLALNKSKKLLLNVQSETLKTNLIIFNVSASLRAKVNITVAQVSIMASLLPCCKFGGMVTIEYLDTEYKENILVCEPLDQGRSFYSYNSYLILVLYWYDALNVSLHISQTNCKFIEIDQCIRKYDPLYLDYITKYSNIILSAKDTLLSLEYHNEVCSILQLRHVRDDTCSISFSLGSSSKVVEEIRFSMQNMYMGDFFKYEEVGMYYPNDHTKCFDDTINNGLPEMHHYEIDSNTQSTFPIIRKPAKRCLIIKAYFKYLTRNWVELTIKNESIKCLFRLPKMNLW